MAKVKLFTWYGMIGAPIVAGHGAGADLIHLLKHPYLGGEVLDCTDEAVTSHEITAPDQTQIALVQVENGHRVAYELTPAGQDLRLASKASPTIEGNAILQFGPGWRLSVVEA